MIAVGRFFPSADGNNKKHDVLIKAFRRLAPVRPATAGSCTWPGGARARSRFAGLPRATCGGVAEDLPVRFYANAER